MVEFDTDPLVLELEVAFRIEIGVVVLLAISFDFFWVEFSDFVDTPADFVEFDGVAGDEFPFLVALVI